MVTERFGRLLVLVIEAATVLVCCKKGEAAKPRLKVNHLLFKVGKLPEFLIVVSNTAQLHLNHSTSPIYGDPLKKILRILFFKTYGGKYHDNKKNICCNTIAF